MRDSLRPALRNNEAKVQASLHALGILDSAPEAEFDALVQAAALVCDVPISLFSLVDADRQWFKANLGLPGVAQSSRESAFCAYAVLGDDLFEVPDAPLDQRFAANPFVTGDPRIRFYAGAPVHLSDGSCVGTLCVLDTKPKELDVRQRAVLMQLATAAARALEGRHATRLAEVATAELALSEARFKALSDGLPLGVFHSDAHGRLTYANPLFLEILGLAMAEVERTGWLHAISPFDRASVDAAWRHSVAERLEFDAQCRVLRRHAPWRDVHIRAHPIRDRDGQVIGHVGSIEDKTAQGRLLALVERTGRLASVGGWELDLRTNAITWSGQTRAIHEAPPGYTPTYEEALGFFGEEARPLLIRAVKSSVARETSWDLELPLVTAKGNRKWVRALGELEREDGKPVRLLGALQDVTELRHEREKLQQEQALRTLVEEQALETERLLKERSEMLDVLAHEVRQPLNNASAALQGATLAIAGLDHPVVSSRLAKAQAVMNQVLARIDNNLAVASLLARPDPIQLMDTDLELLLRLTQAELSAADRGRLRIDDEARVRTAPMDPNLMRLALRNLLANAMRYASAGSTVTLRLRDTSSPSARFLTIDVVSEGAGIPGSVLPRLFQRQRQTERDARLKQGMGLGLYIVRRVMELHGGSVTVASNGPEGVTMRLCLGLDA